MTQVHRMLDGQWAMCDDAACALPIHVPNMSVEQIMAVPDALLWPLIEVFDPPSEIEEGGYKNWYNEQGQFHRDYDLPAEIAPDGTPSWHQRDMLHREGGKPAVIWSWGQLEWWQQGLRHREGAPAVLSTAASYRHEEWWANGQRHREGAPAIIRDGEEEWWHNGNLHREGAPAVIKPDGTKLWYMHGRLIREEVVDTAAGRDN